MRKQLVKVLTTISFVIAIAMAAFGSAQGQSLANPIKVQIPFEFTVADKTMPAGEYLIGRLPEHLSDNVVTISSKDGSRLAIRLTNAVQSLDSKDKATLIFHRYGDQNFLFQVWPAGARTGRVLIKSKSERAIEKNQVLARANNTPVIETVTLVAGLQ